MPEDQKNSKILKLIFLVGFLVPLLLMSANFVYDEFWTILNFVPLDAGRILIDLSLPNNHPLNTLLMKFLQSFSDQPVVLRLPSLICGAMIPVLCGKLAAQWSRCNKQTALISGALLAIFSVPLAVYSGLARGYAVQQFSLLLCIWAMSKVKENSRKAAVLSVIGALGTFISVPNGALFLLPVGIGYLIFSEPAERKNREMWIAAGVIAVLAGIFYAVNFSALREAQIWGEKIESVAGFWQFFRRTMFALVLVPPFLLTIPVWISSRKRAAAAGLLMLPVLLAVFSNAGPERCYLYFSVALAVAGGIGAAELSDRIPAEKRKWIIFSVVILLATGAFCMQYRFWKVTDYVAVFEKNMHIVPKGVVPVYRASSGFPIRCGIGESELADFNDRIFNGEVSSIAFFECGSGEFNGLDLAGGEKVISGGVEGRPAEYSGLQCREYALYRESSIAGKGDYLLITFDKKVLSVFDKKGQVLLLNPWLSTGTMVLFQSSGEELEIPENVRVYRIAEVRK